MRTARPTTALLVALLLAGSVPLAGCTGGRHPSAGPTTAPWPSRVDERRGRSDPVADPVYPAHGNPALDVLRYTLALTYQPDRRTLSGTASLRVRAVAATGTFRLDLGAAMTVDSATVNGRRGAVTRAGDTVTVTATRTAPANAVVTLAFRYHGRPAATPIPSDRTDDTQLGFRALPDGSAFSMQEPYGGFTWYPCNDQPSDKALYDVAITVPDGWTAVSGGRSAGDVEAHGGGRTFRWSTDEPAASYLVPLAIGHLKKVTATGPHDLPITYWAGDDQTGALAVARTLPDMIRFLEQRFGRYPFSTAGVVLVHSASGMETQTMITMGAPAGAMSDSAAAAYQDTIAHELTHQWFGDAVTPKTWRDLWLNEGFAMYVQLLYSASRGHSDRPAVLARWRSADQGLRDQYGPPAGYNPAKFADSNVYICPALMLDEIGRRIGGDDALFALMRDWVQQHRYTGQDAASFTAFVDAHTGQNLAPLINSWLTSPTTPPTTS